MAELIRQEYRLPALRFSMQFVKREPFIQIRAYHGREELAVESIPAAEVGIRERLSVRAYRGVQFRLPRQVIQRLADALSGRGNDDTVWLQIDRSAGFLAVVPWERLLAPVMPGPLLRIPNFLVDPAFHRGSARVGHLRQRSSRQGILPGGRLHHLPHRAHSTGGGAGHGHSCFCRPGRLPFASDPIPRRSGNVPPPRHRL